VVQNEVVSVADTTGAGDAKVRKTCAGFLERVVRGTEQDAGEQLMDAYLEAATKNTKKIAAEGLNGSINEGVVWAVDSVLFWLHAAGSMMGKHAVVPEKAKKKLAKLAVEVGGDWPLVTNCIVCTLDIDLMDIDALL